YLSIAGRRLDHREDRLAERARLGELGEAPFRGEPVRRLDDDDGLGLLDLSVERLLPVGPGRDASRFVEVEKCRLEPLAREPSLHPRGRFVVEARMRDEDARHAAFPDVGPISRLAGLRSSFEGYQGQALLQSRAFGSVGDVSCPPFVASELPAQVQSEKLMPHWPNGAPSRPNRRLS